MTQSQVPAWASEYLSLSAQGRWYLGHGRIVPVRQHRRGRFGLGRCHSNASWLARRWPAHYERWVGYGAADRRFGLVDNHSWVRSLVDGEHIEVTWGEPGAFYIGVPVSAGFSCACVTFHPNECTALRALGRCRAGLGYDPPRPENVRP